MFNLQVSPLSYKTQTKRIRSNQHTSASGKLAGATELRGTVLVGAMCKQKESCVKDTRVITTSEGIDATRMRESSPSQIPSTKLALSNVSQASGTDRNVGRPTSRRETHQPNVKNLINLFETKKK